MYEQDKDVLVCEEKIEGEDTLIVSVHRYKDGQPKVQISRQKEDKFSKLGRLTQIETESILPLLRRAVENMVNATSEVKKNMRKVTAEKAPEPKPEYEITKTEDMPKALLEIEEEIETKTEEVTMQDIKEVKPDLNNMKSDFRIIMTEPMKLKQHISVLNGLLTEVELNIKKEGIEFTQMDPANVAMVIYRLEASSCAEYYVKEDMKIGINLNNLNIVLKAITKKDVLEIRKKGDCFELTIKGASTSTETIPIIEIDQREQKVPALEFRGEVKMNSKALKDAVTKAGNVAESVSFELSKDSLILKAKGDIAENMSEFKEGPETRISLKENIRCKYSIEYLKKMVKCCNAFEEVVLKFGTDYPVMLSYTEVDKAKVSFILAPRIETE